MDATHILYALVLAERLDGSAGVVRCAKRLRSRYPKFRITCNRLIRQPSRLIYDVANYLFQLEAQVARVKSIDTLKDWLKTAEPYILEGVEINAETFEGMCDLVAQNLEPCTISRALKKSYNAISNSNCNA